MTIHPQKIIRSLPFLLLCLLIIGYAVFNSQAFIGGPQITITQPSQGQSFLEPRITIEGNALHIKELSINDRPVSVTLDGAFKEQLLLLPGYNIIKIQAQDAFGRVREERLELVLLQDIDIDALVETPLVLPEEESSATVSDSVTEVETEASTTTSTN